MNEFKTTKLVVDNISQRNARDFWKQFDNMQDKINNLQSKIDKANEMLQLLHYKFKDEDNIHNEIEDIQKCLKEDK